MNHGKRMASARGKLVSVAVLLVLTLLLSACGGGGKPSQPAAPSGGMGQPAAGPGSAPAASGQPKQGGVLRIAFQADATTMDLHKSTNLADRVALLNVQELLVAPGEKLDDVIPGLATKWEILNDGKLYRFTLREGVKFHNGKTMTAEDVKYSVDRFLQVAPRKKEFDSVQEVKVVNPTTVEFVLKRPDGALLSSLTNPFNPLVIIPKGLAEEQGGTIKTPIGTGPFQFVEWVQARHIKLKRFPDYKPWDGEPSGFGGKKVAYVDEVVFQIVPEAAVRVTSLEAGDVDFAAVLPAKDIKRLQGNKALTMYTTPSMSWGILQLGFKKPPFDKKEMRQAFAYAINKEEIAQAATYGAGSVAHTPMFPGSFWAQGDVHKPAADYKQDLNKVKELLQKAGYKGEKIVISASKSYDHHERTALTLQAQLKAAGMNAEIEFLEWASLMGTRWTPGTYNIIITHITPRPDPHQIYYAYTHSNSNYNGYKSAETDRLLDAAVATIKPEERRKLYDQAWQQIHEDVPYVSTYWVPVVEGSRSYVKGYKVWSADYIRLWNVWLDK